MDLPILFVLLIVLGWGPLLSLLDLSFLARDGNWAPYSGGTESQLLDRQGNLRYSLFGKQFDSFSES